MISFFQYFIHCIILNLIFSFFFLSDAFISKVWADVSQKWNKVSQLKKMTESCPSLEKFFEGSNQIKDAYQREIKNSFIEDSVMPKLTNSLTDNDFGSGSKRFRIGLKTRSLNPYVIKNNWRLTKYRLLNEKNTQKQDQIDSLRKYYEFFLQYIILSNYSHYLAPLKEYVDSISPLNSFDSDSKNQDLDFSMNDITKDLDLFAIKETLSEKMELFSDLNNQFKDCSHLSKNIEEYMLFLNDEDLLQTDKLEKNEAEFYDACTYQKLFNYERLESKKWYEAVDLTFAYNKIYPLSSAQQNTKEWVVGFELGIPFGVGSISDSLKMGVMRNGCIVDKMKRQNEFSEIKNFYGLYKDKAKTLLKEQTRLKGIIKYLAKEKKFSSQLQYLANLVKAITQMDTVSKYILKGQSAALGIYLETADE
ncbi:MAG: hypothetical protein QE271_09430 [Bacteriovoracaceae bacterium]|nr:hypothetical protein [Bacteriovoracaceae bacterium]